MKFTKGFELETKEDTTEHFLKTKNNLYGQKNLGECGAITKQEI